MNPSTEISTRHVIFEKYNEKNSIKCLLNKCFKYKNPCIVTNNSNHDKFILVNDSLLLWYQHYHNQVLIDTNASIMLGGEFSTYCQTKYNSYNDIAENAVKIIAIIMRKYFECDILTITHSYCDLNLILKSNKETILKLRSEF